MTDEQKRVAEILADTRPLPSTRQDLEALVSALKKRFMYAPARRLLLKIEPVAAAHDSGFTDDDSVWIQQQLALCTYKDEERPASRRLDEALHLLERLATRPGQDTNAETLALHGAVYKRKWEYEGTLEHLYQALAFYTAAFTRNRSDDLGYGGVNAAYILDILAARSRSIERRSGISSGDAERLARDARQLRIEIKEALEAALRGNRELPQKEWFLVTYAEVEFGLGNYDAAASWLAKVKELPAEKQSSEWERQTTFRQLVSIARLQGNPPPTNRNPAQWEPCWRALHAFLGDDTATALSCVRGKVGLALSGGGFRASFFHLGVLARLAELDMLRSIDVLSTVSGGSIVGAHYYLELQQLLESKPDSQIDASDYVDIVKRLQQDFLRGAQRNLRMRALADLGANLQMVRDPNDTRSHRMGELYEQELYRSVPQRSPHTSGDITLADGNVLPRHTPGRPRRMRELLITPAKASGEPALDFKPQFSNWRRSARVPVLLLNTTSLNSGHLWHFTASWMGEPPGFIETDIDVNQRYRRLYYTQAPPQLQNYRLGYAVAASACVPGLFEPLVIDGLFPERTVRLVDGGVHDNQGVAGLLDQGCSLILCSDASGQMENVSSPPGGLLGPLLRTSQSILMHRIREVEYQDLWGRVASRALTCLFFIHLKQDLPTQPLDWIGCDDKTLPPAHPRTTTNYGIDVDIQRQLSDIRTDLDSFTEVEAYALMLSGYLMTKHQLRELHQEHKKSEGQGTWGDFAEDAPQEDWPFMALEPIVCQPKNSTDPRRHDLAEQLDASASLLFKVWKLNPAWSRLLRNFGIAALVMLGLWIASHPKAAILRLGVLFAGALLVGGAAAAVPAWNWLVPQRPGHNYVGRALAMLGGWVLAHFHLRFFDQRYLQRGELRRLMSMQRIKADQGPDSETFPGTHARSPAS
jgi:predicted acylesterase/phospholipase RssA